MIKLLHTADWQIGKQYGQFEADEAALLAEARFTVIERLAALATAHDVDAVLVAGDLFDAQGVADETLHRLFNTLTTFNGPWVVIPGNHDAALAESVWTRAARLQAIPPHVYVCLKPEPLLLQSLGLAVLPAPLTQRHTHHDLTAWFPSAQLPFDLIRVGLAHGGVQGILADGIDASNPLAAGRAEQARLDYLALGDWHGTKQIDSRTWYSGTPETDRFKANDSGQALIVTIAQPGACPNVTPIKTGHYRWLQHTATLHVPSDLEALQHWLAGITSHNVVDLRVFGHTDLIGHRRLSATISQARGRTRGLLADLTQLRFEPTTEDLAALKADGYLGEVIQTLLHTQSQPVIVTDHGADHTVNASDPLIIGADDNQALIARDALTVLAEILDERRAAS